MNCRNIAPLFAGLMLVAGCQTTTNIPVNPNQTLVMEANLLAAGISADEPVLTNNHVLVGAQTKLYNDSSSPVNVHYRYYWYDGEGLEMHPLEAARTITVPARGKVSVFSSRSFTGARQARLYIYL